jgi:signal transduction histidine kinase
VIDMPAWRDRPSAFAVIGPVVLALIVAGGTIGASHAQPEARPVDAVAIGLGVAAALSLLLARRWPVWVAAVTSAATVVYLALGYPYGPVFAPAAIAIFSAMVRGRRLAAAAAATGLALGVIAVSPGLRHEPWSWPAAGGVLAWVALLLVAGEAVRGRRERFVALRRERMERAGRQAGEERLRIAQEIHDTVAHHMALINMQASVALHLADRKPEQATTALTAIRDASKEGLGELRSLVDMLRGEDGSAPRRPTATLASLDDLVGRTRAAGLDVQARVRDRTASAEMTDAGDPSVETEHLGELPTALDLAAYRIVQESLTNVIRHAHATRAQVAVERHEAGVLVRIDDDGRDGGLSAEAEGSGLRGMRERAGALGGTLEVGRSPMGGWRVTAWLPVRATRMAGWTGGGTGA